MEQVSFYKSFQFNLHRLTSNSHTDNSCGIPIHYLARIVRGEVKIISSSGEELILGVGDVFYLPMGLSYHSYWTVDSDSIVEWESYGFTTLPNANNIHYAMQKIDASGEDRRILDELSKNRKVSPISVGLLYLFLGRAFPNMRVDRVDSKAAIWNKAVFYINNTREFHVKDLAAYCNMSESGIYAFFKQYAKTTPIELKNNTLVKRAVNLLTTTDMPIEEISDRVGFCNPAYMRKQLKKFVGKTPSQIRRAKQTI